MKGSCYAIEAFCAELSPEEISPFVDGMVSQLSQVLSNSQVKEIQEIALSALSSTAMAAEDKFIPHAPALLPLLVNIIQSKDEEYIQLR